jgi:mevalonate kinase
MKSTASAPGKAILFGEHAVVFGKPAIAVAVDKRAQIIVRKGKEKYTTLKSDDLGVQADLDLFNNNFIIKKGKSGIIKYILEALMKVHDGSPLDIELNMEMPIGAGLGSSAAVTVATLAALTNYHKKEIKIPHLAKQAHEVEIKVQGAASPLDTAVSAYGGLVYLSENSEVIPLDSNLEDSLVIGYTSQRGNTGKMVESVRVRRDNHPEIMDPVIESVGKITREARKILSLNDSNSSNHNSSNHKHNPKSEHDLGELMNINHGLLDAMGVNTLELSKMVYTARRAGALGAKITGAGGGGSIIAYCPGKISEVLNALQQSENALKADFSKDGIIIH